MDSFDGQLPQSRRDWVRNNEPQRHGSALRPSEDMSGFMRSGFGPSVETQLRRPNSSINSNNTSMTDQMNELTQQTNSLSFGSNDNNYNNIVGAGDLSHSVWNKSEPKGQSSQSSLSSGPTTSTLSPFAKEFIPRAPMTSFPNWDPRSGNNLHPELMTRDFDDFIALSYLRDFLDTIAIKPNKYDSGIQYLTEVINSYMDEDEDILTTIVNIIVDQSITDVQFRYNGVRLCIHFMEHLVPLSSDKSFKLELFSRCQREYKRHHLFEDMKTERGEGYLRGLTWFVGEIYSRCTAPEFAEYLPQYLISLISREYNKENIKCVCQVLKLCGENMERHYKEKGTDDILKVIEKLKPCLDNDVISVYMKEMIANVIEMQANGWKPLVPAHPPQVNPYLNTNYGVNNTPNAGHSEELAYVSDEEDQTFQDYQTCYDFGQCGDEGDSEVCEAFEEFLKNSGQNN